MEGLRGVWALRDARGYDRFLVQAFVAETRVLEITGEEMGEVELLGLSQEFTLFCGNMGHSSSSTSAVFAQITPTRIRLIDISPSSPVGLLFEFVAPRPITVGTCNASRLVVALAGGELMSFELAASGRALEPSASITLEHDIACLSLHSEATSSSSSDSLAADDVQVRMMDESITSSTSELLVVGMWTDGSVRLLEAASLMEVARASTKAEGTGELRHTQARSALLARLGDCTHSTLLVGLGDGTLLIFNVEGEESSSATTASNKLSVAKRMTLGTQPIGLTSFLSAGMVCAFAACDRPTVVYGRNDKVALSVVNTGEVSSMTPFSSELFPECIALVRESGLTVASVDDIQKIHVLSYPLQQTPKRIAYSKSATVFAGVPLYCASSAL